MNNSTNKIPRITVYTNSRCPHCQQAKAYLRKNQIRFSEQNIEKSRRAFTEFQRLGCRGVPVIMIGKQKIDGFTPKRLQLALKKAGLVSL